MNKVGLRREPKDAFYTKPEVAGLLVEKLDGLYRLKKFNKIVEPSAGDGAFSNKLLSLKLPFVAMDIDPKQPYIMRHDFLEYPVDKLKKHKNVLVIGNPPFGRQSTLARQFIQKAGVFAHVIAFVLPKSFKKSQYREYFPKQFHLVFQQNLPTNSFLLNGLEYDVPCVFQVWEKREEERRNPPKETPIHFSFVKKEENPHLSIRRIGANAGVISYEIENKNTNSHYFIRLKDGITKKRFYEAYQADISFHFDNTVGPKSISKQELIRRVNRLST